MYKTLSYVAAGTLGFVGSAADSAAQVSHQVTNGVQAITQDPAAVQQTLNDPDTYLKGLIVSGVIQIALKVVDWLGKKWSERKAKKEKATVSGI